MSTQILAVVVILLSHILPYVGITVESEAIEGAVQTIVTIVGGLWIWYQRLGLQKAVGGVGDVSPLGVRK